MDNPFLKPILMEKVREVSARIGFDASKVTWRTYRNYHIGDPISQFTQKKVNNYGYCYPEKREVFIEEQLIMNSLHNPKFFQSSFS